MQQIKSLNKIPNDWDYELRKNGISFNLFEPINKLISFQQAGKEIYPALQDIYKAFELFVVIFCHSTLRLYVFTFLGRARIHGKYVQLLMFLLTFV